MIDLNILESDLPVYAFDFKARRLLTFDGKEVSGLENPIRKLWQAQPIASFLSAIKPMIFWSPSPSEAAAPYVFARKGVWFYRFSRVDYGLAIKQGLKGVFLNPEFTDPESLSKIGDKWFATIIEAYHYSA